MKKFLVVLMVFAVSILIGVGSSIAAEFNIRPLTSPPAVLFQPHTEQTLGGAGGIFATIGANAYAADPVGTQSNVAIFSNDGSGGSVASFIISIAGNRLNNESGIYQFGNTAYLAPIFKNVTAITNPQAQALVTFFANGTVQVTAGAGADSAAVVIPGTYLSFGNLFGFYIKGPGGTFFTEDSANGGNPQALVYQGNGLDTIHINGFSPGVFTPDEWIFAFEDQPWATTDRDFNDMVYLVESIGAGKVPEPLSLILLGGGLAGAGLYRRLRKPKP